MADILKTEGLVIAYNYNGNIYPLACSKNSTISITSEFLELAPKTNNVFREYIPNRKTFTINGSGLVKLSQTNLHPIDFFQKFMVGYDVQPNKQYIIKAETKQNLVDFTAIPTNVVAYNGNTTQLIYTNSELGSPFLDSDLYIDVNGTNVVTKTDNGTLTLDVNGGDVITAYTKFFTAWASSGYYRLYIYNQTDGILLYDSTVFNPTIGTTVHTHTFTAQGGYGKFTTYLDLIDTSNNYSAYEMECYITEFSLESSFGSNPSYSFSLQGTGPLTQITENDTFTVASGKITGRNPATYRLVAIGYGGKWYYNYVVTSPSAGVYEIIMGTSLNGTSVKAIYKTL
jgi:hypothetical protein